MFRKIVTEIVRPVEGGRQVYRTVDLLRGIASLAILLVHYNHFFAGVGHTARPPESIYQVAYFDYWAPVYNWGANAVQLFWLISGFVFLHVYGSRQGVTVGSYTVSRLARLYPLHLITLTLTAVLQWLNMHQLGGYAIYQHNDAFHFVLNLGFASEWGLQAGRSFNGPIWSVSVEIFSYTLFFVALKFLRFTPLTLLAMTTVAVILYGISPSFVALCAVYFFAGCLTYSVMKLLERCLPRCVLPISVIGLLVGVAVAATNQTLPRMFLYVLIFGSMVILVCQIEQKFGSERIARWDWIGHTSYGNYLWHSPLQMIFLFLAGLGVVNIDVIYHGYFLVLYMAVVMSVSVFSFRYIEKPLQETTRRWFLHRSPVQSIPIPGLDELALEDKTRLL